MKSAREFVERFIEADADNALFFLPSAREGHAMFDLAGYIRTRLENAGVLMIDDIGVDTYADENFFSYRRSVHRKEPDYGRHVHAIVLEREAGPNCGALILNLQQYGGASVPLDGRDRRTIDQAAEVLQSSPHLQGRPRGRRSPRLPPCPRP